jgi:hypothetical protein
MTRFPARSFLDLVGMKHKVASPIYLQGPKKTLQDIQIKQFLLFLAPSPSERAGGEDKKTETLVRNFGFFNIKNGFG